MSKPVSQATEKRLAQSTLGCAALASLCLVFSSGGFAQDGSPGTLLDALQAQQATLAAYQSDLENLESEFGVFDNSLLEPLEGMLTTYLEAGRWQNARDIQARRLQILRTNLGPQNPELATEIDRLVAIELRLGNHQSVADQLASIRSLYNTATENSTRLLLQAINRQAQWHIAQVRVMSPSEAARSLLDARDLFAESLALAEQQFSEDSLDLVPFLYREAIMQHYLVAAMNSDDMGGAMVRRVAREDGAYRLDNPRVRGALGGPFVFSGQYLDPARTTPVLEKGDLIGEVYLREGLGKIRDIRELYEQREDLEAQGMARIYEGDFQLLMGMGTGFKAYREGMDLLRQAGVSQQEIDTFFSKPVVIPAPRFFSRLNEAIDALGLSQPTTDPGIVHIGNFEGFSEDLPSIEKPGFAGQGWEIELPAGRVELEFHVGRSGRVYSVDALASEPDSRRLRRRAVRAFREVKIRPAVIEGKSQLSKDVRATYYHPELD